MKTIKQYIVFALVVISSTVVLAGNPPGHWTFPGESISSHLGGYHRVSTAGMTYEQMLNLHDKIHREEAMAKYGNKQVITTTKQPVRIFRWFRR